MRSKLSARYFIFQTEVSCFSVTLFYSTLLALTHRQNHKRRNKYTCCAWAGGSFFPVVLLCQFLFWQEIGFGFTYLRTLLTNYFMNKYFSNSCWSISYVFRWVHLSIKLRPVKKRYSPLAVGWNKSQVTVCRVKIRTPPIIL